MRRLELVRRVSARTGIPQKDVSIIVDALFDEMKAVLLSKQEIEIRGFGSFRIVKRKPKKGRVIKTGEEVIIPERYVVKFKPSKYLKIK